MASDGNKKAEELAREIREAEKDRKDPDVPARGRPEHRTPKD